MSDGTNEPIESVEDEGITKVDLCIVMGSPSTSGLTVKVTVKGNGLTGSNTVTGSMDGHSNTGSISAGNYTVDILVPGNELEPGSEHEITVEGSSGSQQKIYRIPDQPWPQCGGPGGPS